MLLILYIYNLVYIEKHKVKNYKNMPESDIYAIQYAG